MKTTWGSGSRDDTDALLRRFDGRIGAWDALAYSALVAMDYAEMADTTAEAPLTREVAQGLRELYLDYQDFRAAIAANDDELRAIAYPKQDGAE
jgi:hypothetical protein